MGYKAVDDYVKSGRVGVEGRAWKVDASPLSLQLSKTLRPDVGLPNERANGGREPKRPDTTPP